MKKWVVSFVLLLLTVSLVACSSNENAQDVYTKAMEVAEEMKSAEITMDLNQNLKTSDDSLNLEMKNSSEAKVTLDPIAMHQSGKMNMVMNGSETESDTEMYMTEEGMYTFDPMSETWMKLDTSALPDFANTQQQNPQAQLELLEPILDDVVFEETDEGYTFKYSGEGEEVNQFTKSLMEDYVLSDTMAALGEEATEILESMTVNKLNYEMVIDKETYETKSFNMDLDMIVEANEEEMGIVQSIRAKYTGINTVDSIEIPQEVLDNAVELN